MFCNTCLEVWVKHKGWLPYKWPESALHAKIMRIVA